MTTISELADVEAIKVLKARYIRFLDTKNWDGLASLFTDDAVFDVGIELDRGKPSLTKAEYVRLTRDTLSKATSVHQAYMPEVTITGPTTATGIWGMCDYLDFHGAPGPLPSGGTVVRGYGHYHEDYVKEDGEWRISSYRVDRLRTDDFARPEPALTD